MMKTFVLTVTLIEQHMFKRDIDPFNTGRENKKDYSIVSINLRRLSKNQVVVRIKLRKKFEVYGAVYR